MFGCVDECWLLKHHGSRLWCSGRDQVGCATQAVVDIRAWPARVWRGLQDALNSKRIAMSDSQFQSVFQILSSSVFVNVARCVSFVIYRWHQAQPWCLFAQTTRWGGAHEAVCISSCGRLQPIYFFTAVVARSTPWLLVWHCTSLSHWHPGLWFATCLHIVPYHAPRHATCNSFMHTVQQVPRRLCVSHVSACSLICANTLARGSKIPPPLTHDG